MRGQLFIDGVWREGAGARFESIDPATGRAVWAGAAATSDDVARAYAAARRAGRDWSRRPRAERVALMNAYQAVLQARAADMAAAISRETGKALWETRAELSAMAAKVDVSIRAYDERTGEREATTGFGRAVLRHKPHGVAAVLGPFNFPGHLPNGHIVPALLAGDTVVFKPSEETPHTGELMAEAFEAAGLPAGVFNLIQGARETGAALLDQPIDALLFTGSAAAGAHFRQRFADAPHLVMALELGGNNPLVVWDVADPAAAAGHIVQSAFVTTGQRCSCARRLIVKSGAEGDAVVAAVAELSQRLVIGAWDAQPEPYMGPLISARGAQSALQAVERLTGQGATSLMPFAGAPELGPAFVRPGMVDVSGMEPPDEEIFAPVLQVFRVDSLDAAIARANRTRYGLSAGLLTDRAELWETFLEEIRAGVVNLNRPTTGAAGDMPFGGLGDSGNHRPSAWYAADYCAYPVASFEAAALSPIIGEMKGVR